MRSTLLPKIRKVLYCTTYFYPCLYTSAFLIQLVERFHNHSKWISWSESCVSGCKEPPVLPCPMSRATCAMLSGKAAQEEVWYVCDVWLSFLLTASQRTYFIILFSMNLALLVSTRECNKYLTFIQVAHTGKLYTSWYVTNSLIDCEDDTSFWSSFFHHCYPCVNFSVWFTVDMCPSRSQRAMVLSYQGCVGSLWLAGYLICGGKFSRIGTIRISTEDIHIILRKWLIYG